MKIFKINTIDRTLALRIVEILNRKESSISPNSSDRNTNLLYLLQVEVGHSDVPSQSQTHTLLHSLPSVQVVDSRVLHSPVLVAGDHLVGLGEAGGPVHQEEVQLLQLEVGEGALQSGDDVFWRVFRVPQLRGYPDVLPLTDRA